MNIETIYDLQLMLIWCLIFLSINISLIRLYPMPKSINFSISEEKERRDFAEFCAYFTSFLNGFVSFFAGLSIVISNGVSLMSPNRSNETSLLCFTLGYFLSDTIVGIVYKYNNFMMNLHHLVILMCGLFSLFNRVYSNLAILGLVISELPNVFRAIEKILDRYPENKRISFVFGMCFATTFIFCRFLKQKFPIWTSHRNDNISSN